MLQSTPLPLTIDETTVTDQELIQSALGGDQRGYDLLARRYQDRLYHSICNDVGCAVLAEDIVQDAFVRAFLHLDSFRGNSGFYTWLYRIALNSRRAYFRKRVKTLPLDVEDTDVTNEPVDSPPSSMERHEERSQVRTALSRLEDHHRRILILREFEGFDYQTIADVLHVKTGTVRSRLARARARLRKELSSYVDGGVTVGS